MKKQPELTILYEDEHICVCIKPSGIPCENVKVSQVTMIGLLKKHYFLQNPEDGEPYIVLIHRLDQPVGGIMVFARSQKAAAELSRQIQNHIMKKQYLALIMPDKTITKLSDHLEDYLIKDGKTNTSKITASGNKQAKKAVLDYEVIKQGKYQEKEAALVKVTLTTGRHHQIRVQMAGHGLPLFFDQKYNSFYRQSNFKENIALYSYHLSFYHPVTKAEMSFTQYPKDKIFNEI